jgi:hypothetical protein
VARLWKLRQRFGIAAPKVAVRTHVPWYLRWLALTVLLVGAAVLAGWTYEAGRRYAGFDRGAIDRELTTLRSELAAGRAELDQLRTVANAADSRIAIERTAQENLARQLRVLEADNARLREELAVLEGMLSANGRKAAPLAIQRFKVQPDPVPGEYRYQLLVIASGAAPSEFHGRYELVVSLSRNGRSAMMSVPESGSADAKEFALAFKRFQRIEGTFRIDPAAQLETVQVRVYDNSSKQARAIMTAESG